MQHQWSVVYIKDTIEVSSFRWSQGVAELREHALECASEQAEV